MGFLAFYRFRNQSLEGAGWTQINRYGNLFRVAFLSPGWLVCLLGILAIIPFCVDDNVILKVTGSGSSISASTQSLSRAILNLLLLPAGQGFLLCKAGKVLARALAFVKVEGPGFRAGCLSDMQHDLGQGHHSHLSSGAPSYSRRGGVKPSSSPS